MAKKTKNLVDRARDVMDTLVEALESLLHPPPALVPVRAPHPSMKRRR